MTAAPTRMTIARSDRVRGGLGPHELPEAMRWPTKHEVSPAEQGGEIFLGLSARARPVVTSPHGSAHAHVALLRRARADHRRFDLAARQGAQATGLLRRPRGRHRALVPRAVALSRRA